MQQFFRVFLTIIKLILSAEILEFEKHKRKIEAITYRDVFKELLSLCVSGSSSFSSSSSGGPSDLIQIDATWKESFGLKQKKHQVYLNNLPSTSYSLL